MPVTEELFQSHIEHFEYLFDFTVFILLGLFMSGIQIPEEFCTNSLDMMDQ